MEWSKSFRTSLEGRVRVRYQGFITLRSVHRRTLRAYIHNPVAIFTAGDAGLDFPVAGADAVSPDLRWSLLVFRTVGSFRRWTIFRVRASGIGLRTVWARLSRRCASHLGRIRGSSGFAAVVDFGWFLP